MDREELKQKGITMRNANLVFIDLETTGLDIERHEIIEFGCVIAKQIEQKNSGPKLEFVEEIEIKIKPRHIETASPEGLKINGYNETDWKDAVALEDALSIISKKTEGSIMVAQNVAFDWAFLEKAFLETNIKSRMHYHKLDTISIAFSKLYDNSDIKKFSLRELTKYFGIENKKAHTALSDARATYELYCKLLNC